MHQAILIACLPCLIAIAIAIGLAWLTIRFSGAKLQLARLKEIHSCEKGAVQTLSFAFTMPFFIIITMFIVQVSQLMIGVMTVNYAAYASARAASVWIPADSTNQIDSQDDLPVESTAEGPSVLIEQSSLMNRKPREIFMAAVLGCAPICPSSGQSHLSESNETTEMITATTSAFELLTDATYQNSRTTKRLGNKLRYAAENTAVRVTWKNKHAVDGPTYNPIGHPTVDFHESLIGWDDPVTVTVTHQFALLPGPGRLLAKYLVRADGKPDEVSSRIDYVSGTYKTPIVAKVTFTIQGLKSLRD